MCLQQESLLKKEKGLELSNVNTRNMTTRGSKLAELPIARRQGRMFSSEDTKPSLPYINSGPFSAMQSNMVDIIQDMF